MKTVRHTVQLIAAMLLASLHISTHACPAKAVNNGEEQVVVVSLGGQGIPSDHFELTPGQEVEFGDKHTKVNMFFFWPDGTVEHVHQIACTADKGLVTFNTQDLYSGKFQSSELAHFYVFNRIDAYEGSPEEE